MDRRQLIWSTAALPFASKSVGQDIVPRLIGEVTPSNANRFWDMMAASDGATIALAVLIAPRGPGGYRLVYDGDWLRFTTSVTDGSALVAAFRNPMTEMVGGSLAISGMYQVRNGGMANGNLYVEVIRFPYEAAFARTVRYRDVELMP